MPSICIKQRVIKMTKIYNFEKSLVKRVIKKFMGIDSLETEIYLTVIKFVHLYMELELEDPLAEIKIDDSLEKLFGGDPTRFAKAFVDLVEYWELGPLSEQDIPIGQEFKYYRTIEDLCLFVDGKLKVRKELRV